MLKVLILEDNHDDVMLMQYELKAAGIEFELKAVDTKQDFIKELKSFKPDIVLADYALPDFNGLEALAVVKSIADDVPFILVSGAIGEELAVGLMHRGAKDYVMKTQMFRLREVLRAAVEDSAKAAQIAEGRERALRHLERRRDYGELGNECVRILILEDREDDARLLQSYLKKELVFESRIAETEKEFRKYLKEFKPDIILADFSLPSFDGLSALKMRDEICKHVPFFFVSSIIGEDVAIESLKLGVTDYVMKDNPSRLVASIKRALSEARERRLRQATEEMLAERQEMIRSILEGATDAIITFDNDGITQTINPAFEKMFGFTEEDATGLHFNKFVAEPPFKELRRSCADLEFVAKRKDGTEFPVGIATSEVKLKGNTFVTAIIRDISERQRLHTQLQEQIVRLELLNSELEGARNKAQEALALKSQFVANISHEIRTPMSGVLGMAELLITNKLEGESKTIAEHIYTSAKSLLLIVNDILDFSKLEAGKVKLDKRQFAVGTLIDQVAQSIQPSATKKGLKVSIEISPEVPAEALGDEGRLKQALLNLAHNAIKFTNSGSVSISVKLDCQSGDIAMFRFSVTDTGIGISEQAQKDLFVPFMQADNSTTRKYGGTGLGLSICKSLADLMDGQVGLESDEGIGSTFWFVVPLKVVSKSANDPPASRKSAALKRNH